MKKVKLESTIDWISSWSSDDDLECQEYREMFIDQGKEKLK